MSVPATECCIFVFTDFCSPVKKEFVISVSSNLEKPASETYEVLQKAFYGDAMSRTQPLNGIYILELAVHGLKIWNVQIIHCQD